MKNIISYILVLTLICPAVSLSESNSSTSPSFMDRCSQVVQRVTGSSHTENQRVREVGTPVEYVDRIVSPEREDQVKTQFAITRRFHQLAGRFLQSLLFYNTTGEISMPAAYSNDQSDYDALGVIDNYISSDAIPEEIEKASAEIEKWISDYEKYYERLLESAVKGFTARRQLKELEGTKRRGLKYGPEDFDEENGIIYSRQKFVTTELSYWEDGRFVKRQKSWGRYPDFRNYVAQLRIEYLDTFTHSHIQELRKDSDLYGELLKQAILRRLLKILYFQLKSMNPGGQTSEHQQMQQRLEVLLKKSELFPRHDANIQRLLRELKAEIKYVFSSNRQINQSRRISAQSLTQAGQQALRNSSFLRFLAPRNLFLTTALFTSLSAFVYWNLIDRGFIGTAIAGVNSSYVKTIRDHLEATGSERACAAESRYFNSGICIPQNARALIAPELIRARSLGVTNPEALDEGQIVEFLQEYMFQAFVFRGDTWEAWFYSTAKDIQDNYAPLAYSAFFIGDILASYTYAANHSNGTLDGFKIHLGDYYGLSDRQKENQGLTEIVQKMVQLMDPKLADQRPQIISEIQTLTKVDVQPFLDYIAENEDEIKSYVQSYNRIPENFEEMVRTHIETVVNQNFPQN